MSEQIKETPPKELMADEKIIKEKISSVGAERIETIEKERKRRDFDILDIDEKENQFFGFSVYSVEKKMEKIKDPQALKLWENALSSRLEKIQDNLIEIANNDLAKNNLYSAKTRLQYWFNNGINYEKDPEKFISERLNLNYTDKESKEYIDSEIDILTIQGEKINRKEKEKMRLKIIIDEAAELCSMKYIQAAKRHNRDGLLSNDILNTIIKNNIEIWKEKEIELKKEVAVMKEKFMYQIKNNIDNGELPISMDEIKEVVKSTEFSIVDSMNAELREVYGDYTAETHKVRLSPNIPKDLRYHAFTHEMLHALSGKQDLLVYHETDLPIELFSTIENIRIGTRLKSNFSWLNEALTEKAAMDVMKTEEDKNFYLPERKVLDFLINTLEIPRELFYKAYFENYNPKKEGHKQPHLKELFDYTNKNFGNGFLINLDKFICRSDKNLGKKEKPDFDWDSVFKDIEKEGKNFPKFVNEFFNKPIA